MKSIHLWRSSCLCQRSRLMHVLYFIWVEILEFAKRVACAQRSRKYHWGRLAAGMHSDSIWSWCLAFIVLEFGQPWCIRRSPLLLQLRKPNHFEEFKKTILYRTWRQNVSLVYLQHVNWKGETHQCYKGGSIHWSYYSSLAGSRSVIFAENTGVTLPDYQSSLMDANSFKLNEQ